MAELTPQAGQAMGYKVEIQCIDNPRKEAGENYYNPTYQGLIELGVEPHYLTAEVMTGMFKLVAEYQNNIRKDVIFRGVCW
jgi:UDP-sulfoquinovose synthase